MTTASTEAATLPQAPRLADNITHFARALRHAGLPIGPGRVLDAVQAVAVAGFSEREDFYWTLQACFVSRPDHRAIFDSVFRLFWRDPRHLETLVAVMAPALREAAPRPPAAAETRAAEALLAGLSPDQGPEDSAPDPKVELQVDVSDTASARERLKTLDFDQMTGAEMVMARRMIADLALPVRPLPSRRRHPAVSGRIDRAQSLRAALRQGGELQAPRRHRPRDRWPDLVVLCDISGSMSRYSRMLLHFVHAIANARGAGWARVHAFTFGTELTNISRHMRHRDVDAALQAAGTEARDWEGGTRIGTALHIFNRDWSRRVMGRGAVVILVTDGLDRGDPAQLIAEAERLQLSARRVIWLNPLLRFDGFAPRARGIRALLPTVDCFLAGHSVASLEALGRALAQAGDSGQRGKFLAALRAP
ncbi:VWA domain-containing protein [Pseudooceanicola sp.]|uniref:vWA domain-containing protein n=1 Tax=Pseudooceanicola sp. TaxID=1914328 RepID=UPI00262CBB43|nr:VWA domain-containing protein [Pseudooceanicola sp.]MDF1855607.1 VWA domain-containing protein [Pseudooceanicola sp.]